MILRYITLLLVFTQSQAQDWDTKLCPELIKTGSLPKLPDRWFVEYKYSIWKGLDGAKNHEEGYEAFDASRKRSGHLYVVNGDLAKTYQKVSDYVNQKSYMIHRYIPYYSSDACRTDELVDARLPVGDIVKDGKAPIGPMLIMYLTGTATTTGLLGAKQLSTDDSVSFRDMTAINYAGCHYDAKSKETLKFTWFYINQPGTKNVIPLGATVTVSRPDDEEYTYMRYDFVSFDPNERGYKKLIEDTKVYEIPILYRCNVTTSNTFPDGSNITVQSYSIEYITYDPKYSWLKQQTEKYNYYRRHYWERDNIEVNRTLYPLTRMSDYSTGVRYNINRYYGTCHPSPLDFGLDSAARVFDDGVCMKEPRDMFGDPAKYTYDGVITLRDIDCHMWTTDAYDSNNQLSRRVQWCFASNSTVAGSHPAVEITPILLILAYRNDNTFAILYQELFSFQTSDPPLYAYDVSECFRSTTDPAYMMRHFVIRFPSTAATAATADPILFKTSFIRTVRHVANITDIRIANVLVENAETTDVTFSVLPPAPIPGKLSPKNCPAAPETSIEDAFQKLAASVRSGAFLVELNRPFTNENVYKFTASSNYDDIYELPRRAPLVWYLGYSSAVLTILGVFCAFAGFAAGVALYLYAIVPCLIPYLRSKSLKV